MTYIMAYLPVSNYSILGAAALNTLAHYCWTEATMKMANNGSTCAVDDNFIFIIIKKELEIRL